jgi:hypothetical protein
MMATTGHDDTCQCGGCCIERAARLAAAEREYVEARLAFDDQGRSRGALHMASAEVVDRWSRADAALRALRSEQQEKK